MKFTFGQQLWIAFKIWLFSIIANTFLGTFYLTDFFSRRYLMGDYIVIGALLGSLFSLPAIVLLFIILNRCIARNLTGLWIFRIVFLSGILLTAIVFALFGLWFSWRYNVNALLFIAILSGIIGITTQYKSLLQAGSDFRTSKDYEL